MKRFMIVVVALGVLGLAFFYAKWSYGFYIDLNPDAPVNYEFTTNGTQICKNTDEAKEAFQVKGVEISASMPEHAATDFAPEQEDYLRWFSQISDMGANTVKVAGIMDDTFYNAFYEFNSNRDQPLYLLQGILIQDAVNYGAGDAYESDYMGALIEDGKRMVDVIHGNRMIMENVPGRGTGWYTRDISQWVLGFLMGAEWNGDTVVYTDHRTTHDGIYDGTYFATAEGASPFEAMLARVMDEIIAYESEKYKEQHLIGFANSPDTDPLIYRDDYGELQEKYERAGISGVTYARQLNKISQIDAEHIVPGEELKAGYFAAYNLYDFCGDFYEYLAEEKEEELSDILEAINRDGIYDGYTEFLAKYHTLPVICVSYGFTTSRGVVSEKGFPLTEEEQGERLVEIYEDLCEQGWSGAVINAWQDRWELRSWNTAYAQEFTNNVMWHDLQTESQWYGLMEFTAENRTVDGIPDEWEAEDIVISETRTLSAYADLEGLVLLIQGEGVSPENTLYIPVDTTDKSGSRTSSSPALTFSRPADFLICLDGEENSRILVQERYESIRANFQQEINGENAYIEFPQTNSEIFLPVYMVMENTTMVEYVDYTNRELKYLPTYETGKLRHGNGNPKSEEYDSLADFCYGENCVELRIPWALLNVANPVDQLIHDDYYENYGVDFIQTDGFWLGISGNETEEILMLEFPLKWEDKVYEERLKESYEVVQEAWR